MKKEKLENKFTTPFATIVSGIIIAIAIIYSSGVGSTKNQSLDTKKINKKILAFEKSVVSPKGVILPVSWYDLGSQLVENGSIDEEKIRVLYENRGKFTKEYNQLLTEKNNGKIKITEENASYLLNLFWAIGLANKNEILEKGEMADSQYGGAERFASTGGWTMAVGDPMDHYSMHRMIKLTEEQQILVDKVSRGIYRPCCGNSTHFPDCNHGMAMLGLLELMASQGVNEQDMWKTALSVNSYWFPNTYITIALYMESKGVEWKNVNPQEVLGFDYSSSRGYGDISSQVIIPSNQQSSGGCAV